jgi:hypothetical protein
LREIIGLPPTSWSKLMNNIKYFFILPMKIVTVISLLVSLRCFGSTMNRCSEIDEVLYSAEYKMCLRVEIASSANIDCVECLFSERQQTSPWIEAIGVLAAPLAHLGASAIGSYYGYKSQKEWSNAFEQGHIQCTTRFNDYLNYNIERGSAPILAQQAQDFNDGCNGSPLSGYAGFSGMGGGLFGAGSNPFISGGYTPGFMNGMIGPSFGSSYGPGGIGGSAPYLGIGLNLGLGGGGGFPGGYGGGQLPGMGLGGAGLGLGGGSFGNGYFGGTGGFNESWNDRLIQFQQQQQSQYMDQMQNQAVLSRIQGNAQGNANASQSLYQNLQNAQSNFSSSGGYGYGGPYSVPNLGSSGGGGFGIRIGAGLGFGY